MMSRLEIGVEPTDDHMECMELVEKRTWEMAMGVIVDSNVPDKYQNELLNPMLERYFEVAGYVIGETNE